MEIPIAKHWHHLPYKEILELLDTSPERGLALFEAGHRRKTFGPNEVSARKQRSRWRAFLSQFAQPLVYLLAIASAVTLLLGHYVDAGVIFGVVLVNAIVGYVQEAKAEKAVESLQGMILTETTVLRDGKRQRISSRELVPGDVVILQSGDKIPADLRLLEVRDLQVDESALTGESVAIQKDTSVLPPETVLADRRNMVYAGTLATYGQGTGVVTATGNQTESGRIAEMIAGASEMVTPLVRKIAEFSRLLLYAICALSAVTFVVGLLRGQSVIDMFMTAVALAVGMIPEGLPAAVTITLAIGVSNLARRRAIIRKLPAVETLGSTTVICSDKTGTMTQNQMTVQQVLSADELFNVSGSGYGRDGGFSNSDGSSVSAIPAGLRSLLAAGALCNDSGLSLESGVWKVRGDATEAALLVSAMKAGLTLEALSNDAPRIDVIAFESDRQYMATLHSGPGGNRVLVKGAVERVLDLCAFQTASGGGNVPVDRQAALLSAEKMAAQGYRVLAFAEAGIEPSQKSLAQASWQGKLVFTGLQAMMDPPRPEVKKAVEVCRTAGIRVKMITGDHAVTAAAIAARLGMGDGSGETPKALTGRQLAELSDEQLISTVEEISVFARVDPAQKLRLVEALQARGHVVAMTGDGVNDAPALKQADIGIAMGRGGTDVAREAADMLLTDDNFATIESAIEEGRGVFDNLTKFIIWTLPTNLGEGLLLILAVFLGITLPITPVQILWINMTTALFLGMALAFEPSEKGVMERQPRDPGQPIITKALMARIFTVSVIMAAGGFFVYSHILQDGGTLGSARTVVVNVVVFTEMFYLFNCRSLTRSAWAAGLLSNPWAIGGALCMAGLQVCFTHLPLMNTLFGTSALTAAEWGKVLAVSFASYALIDLEKRLLTSRIS